MHNAIISKATWLKSRPFLIGAFGLTGLTALYLTRLGLPDRLSAREVTAAGWVDSTVSGIAWARVPSALVAMVCVVLLYLLLRRWHSRRVGLMAGALFASTGWMLHTGRLAAPLILFTLVPLALFYLASWLSASKHSARCLVGTAVVYAVLLQIPGAIWFELASAVLLWPIFQRHLNVVKPYVPVVGCVIAAAGIGAVVIQLAMNPATITRWLGAHNGLPDPLQFLDQWAHSVTFLIRGPEAADLWLGHAPLLEAFSLGLFLLGVLVYIKVWRNLRIYMLISFGVIASLLIGLSGITGISYLLPVIFLIIGCGLSRLLQEWYKIFPRNPVARWIGTSLVAGAVALSCSYHLTAYFTAWQRTPATIQAFDREP